MSEMKVNCGYCDELVGYNSDHFYNGSCKLRKVHNKNGCIVK